MQSTFSSTFMGILTVWSSIRLIVICLTLPSLACPSQIIVIANKDELDS